MCLCDEETLKVFEQERLSGKRLGDGKAQGRENSLEAVTAIQRK